MKIAYCMTGHIRTFNKTFPHFKTHMLDKFPGDVFIHTWSKLDSENKSWYKGEQEHPEIFDRIPEVVSLYRPKAMTVEVQENVVNTNWQRESLARSLALAKAHGAYDWAIRIRFDLLLSQGISPDELTKNALHVGVNNWDDSSGLVCDIFSHGPFSLMESYSKLDLHDPASLAALSVDVLPSQARFGMLRLEGKIQSVKQETHQVLAWQRFVSSTQQKP